MTIIEAMFLFFSFVIVGSVLWMIMIRNVVHAAFLLVVALIATAGLFVIYKADYLAVVQILVYAGGVVILLAFGLMLTQQVKEGATIATHHLVFPGLLLVATISFTFLKVLFQNKEVLSANTVAPGHDNMVKQIGKLLMTEYLLAFELIAFLLLVVLVGASYYAKHSSKEVTS